MPLVRFEVRNEYGLGDPELYKAKNIGNHDTRRKKKDDDSKEILDGVAVAGLVGILRQLGDLAQFASEIFHDLHEQVMVTSARGRKLSNRVRNLEAELPLLENSIKGQRSHIHFAYAAGCEYHANLKFEQNHLLSTGLPQYMMDSYEECRDPPRLYLLDRFDINGNGACLKKYSDPSYFKTVLSASKLEKTVRAQKAKKGQKFKRKVSQLNQESQLGSSSFRHFSSTRFAFSNADEHHFSTDTSPISTSRQKPDLQSRQSSFDSRRLRFVEPIVDSNSSGLPDESEINIPYISKSPTVQGGIFAPDTRDKVNVIRMCPNSPVTWDEKSEILKPISPVSCDDIPMDETQLKPTLISSDNSDIESDISEMGVPGISSSSANVLKIADEINSEAENFLDASTILESETETDSEYQTKREFKSVQNMSENMDYSYTSAIRVPDCSTVNQNANHNYVINDTVCNSPERPEMSNVDIVNGPQCFIKEKECNENSFQLVMPEDGSETAMSPYLIRSNERPNYSINGQISNGNSFKFEIVDDQPTGSGTNNKPTNLEHIAHELKFPNSPINQVSDRSSIKVEAAINQSPKSNVSNANDSNSTNSPPVYTSNIPTPKLWTNGILLGLAPSKPPVFNATNESNEDTICNTGTKNPSNETISRNSSHTENMNGGKTINAIKNHIKSYPSESSQSSEDIKSSLASLAQRILANRLQRKQPFALTPSETVVPDVNRSRDNEAESEAESSSNTTVQLNSHFSGNSSPPLEHMKISFHPMNGSEASNLKLEYATEDLTFPSFQLLPKSNNRLEDNGSETDEDDDDTFCRSAYYTSEDHESNSEMWEQDDMTEYSNQGEYSDLDRISLPSSSVSSFKGFFQNDHKKNSYEFGNLEVENSMLYSQNGNSVNIPGLDSVVLDSRSQNELPPPPPLPPMQWRTSKCSSDKKAEKNFSVAEIVEHFNDIFNDLPAQRCTVDEQHEQNIPKSPILSKTMHNTQKLNEHKKTNGHEVVSKQLEINEELSHKTDNQQDIQKLSGHMQPSYISSGRAVGEREDLLLQIRNKSFNLRRTSTTRSHSMPQSTANINITAILKKATAIRQAVVGSDGGDEDDDNWSDS